MGRSSKLSSRGRYTERKKSRVAKCKTNYQNIKPTVSVDPQLWLEAKKRLLEYKKTAPHPEAQARIWIHAPWMIG